MPEHSQITALDHSGHDVCKMTKDSGDESISTTKGENKKTKGALGTQGTEQAGPQIYASRVNAASALYSLMQSGSDLARLQSEFLAQEKESIQSQSDVTNTLADSKSGTIMKNAKASLGLTIGGAVFSLGCMGMSLRAMNKADKFGKNAEGNMGKIGDSLKNNLCDEPQLPKGSQSVGNANQELTTKQAKGLDRLTHDFRRDNKFENHLKNAVDAKQYKNVRNAKTEEYDHEDLKTKLKDADREGIVSDIENKPFIELFDKDKLVGERDALKAKKADPAEGLSETEDEKLEALKYITGESNGQEPSFKEVSYRIGQKDKYSENYKRMMEKKLNKAAGFDNHHGRLASQKEKMYSNKAQVYSSFAQTVGNLTQSGVQTCAALTSAAQAQANYQEQINKSQQQQNTEARGMAKQAFMSVIDSSKDILRNS